MKTTSPPNKTLDLLRQRRLLWQGSDALKSPKDIAVINTGQNLLDQQLHCGGWPLAQLIECIPHNGMHMGAGIFLPALKNLQKNFGHTWPVILLDPPFMPYLAGWSLHPQTPIWVVKTKTIQEKIWLAENALQSNCSLCTLIWLPEKTLAATQIRKLKLAATRNNGLSIIFRDQQTLVQASSTSLRFEIKLCTQEAARKKTVNRDSNKLLQTYLAVHILKQPLGWGGQRCMLPWHSRLQRPRLAVNEWPVYKPAEHSSSLWPDREQSENYAHAPYYS